MTEGASKENKARYLAVGLIMAAVLGAFLWIRKPEPSTPRATIFRFSGASYAPCPRPAEPASILCRGATRPPAVSAASWSAPESGDRGARLKKRKSDPTISLDKVLGRAQPSFKDRQWTLEWTEEFLRRQGAPSHRIHTDLGILRWFYSEQLGTHADVATAVHELDKAWREAPDSPVALFNRATAFEMLGLREDALETWQRFVEVETDGKWRREAESALQRLHRSSALGVDELRGLLERDEPLPAGVARRQALRELSEGVDVGAWVADDPAARELKHRVLQALSDNKVESLLPATLAVADRLPIAVRPVFERAHQDYARGLVHYRQGNLEDASDAWELAEPIFEQHGSPFHASLKTLQAILDYYDGHLADSTRSLRQILSDPAAAGFDGQRARALWILALCHGRQIDYFTARRLFEESRDLYRAAGEPANEAAVLSISGEVLHELGRPHEAWQRRLEALALMPFVTDPKRRHNLLYEAADALQVAGHRRVYLPLLDQMVETAREQDDPIAAVESLIWRAQARSGEQLTAGADSDLAEATRLIRNLPVSGLADRLLADVEWIRGTKAGTEPERALEHLHRAEALYEKAQDPHRLPDLLYDQAEILLSLGRRDKAIEALEEGLRRYESQRRGLPLSDWRVSYFDRSRRLADRLLPLLLDADQVEAAWRISESSKARALKDTAFSEAGTSHLPSLTELARAVGPEFGIVEFVVLPEELILWLPSDPARFRRLNVTERMLDTLVAEIQQAARDNQAERFSDLSAKAYEVLFGPVANLLADKDSWLIIPDKSLHGIPFDSLRTDGVFLFERHTVSTSPSAALAPWMAPSARTPPRLAVTVGLGTFPPDWQLAPLTGAEPEAIKVAEVYGTTPLLGAAADASALQERMRSASVLHLATHAVPNPEFPLRSYLALPNNIAGTLIRPLFAYELYGLRAPHLRLAVLAACHTAGGRLSLTEGPMSLAHPFLAAGVPHVVATLWTLDDSLSRELFPIFHRLYVDGHDPPEALRLAKRQILNQRGPDVVTDLGAVQVLGLSR